MFSDMTRSSVKPEAQQNTTSTSTTRYEAPNTRKKRLRDSLEFEHANQNIDHKKLKTTIHVEQILPPSSTQLHNQHDEADTNTVTCKDASQNPPHTGASAPTPLPSRPHTVHQEKVAAGLKHELDRLQPAASDRNTSDDKRKLRSQESSRYKSELSLYFPDYDFVIGNDQEERHILDVDTPIVITDSRPPPIRASSPGKIRIPRTPSRLPPKQYAASLYTSLNEAEEFDFSVFQQDLIARPILDDPFLHPNYSIAHKRQERLERSIRNTEKGRAQHERDQVIRLLETLESGDWLKCMGVTGIIESRRKDFLEAREYFIRGCTAIVDKFKRWKEEERRRKALKDRMATEEDDDEESIPDSENDSSTSDGDPPDYSDIDHAAARQLHEEAVSRLNSGKGRSSSHTTTEGGVFISFYKNPHLRAAALDPNRRITRGITAFGVPLPHFEDKPFELPAEFLEGRDKVDERSRRREKRQSK